MAVRNLGLKINGPPAVLFESYFGQKAQPEIDEFLMSWFPEKIPPYLTEGTYPYRIRRDFNAVKANAINDLSLARLFAWCPTREAAGILMDLVAQGLYTTDLEVQRTLTTKSPKLPLYYYPQAGKGNRKSTIQLTRLLVQLAPAASADAVRDYAATIVEAMGPERWHVDELRATSDDMAEQNLIGIKMGKIYEECDFGSCMSRKGGNNGTVYILEGLERHPIEVYATPDIALISIYDDTNKCHKARAIVNYKDKKFQKLYPADSTGINGTWVRRLKNWLTKEGYAANHQALLGCRLRRLKVSAPNHDYYSLDDTCMMPYIDGTSLIARPLDSEQYLRLVEIDFDKMSQRYLVCTNTRGYAKFQIGGGACNNCGDDMGGEACNVGWDNRLVCLPCRENQFYYVEGPDIYLHESEIFTCDNCGESAPIVNRNAATSATNRHINICDYCLNDGDFIDHPFTGMAPRHRLHPEEEGPLIESIGEAVVARYFNEVQNRQILLDAEQEGQRTIQITLRNWRTIRIGTFTQNETTKVWTLTNNEERANAQRGAPAISALTAFDGASTTIDFAISAYEDRQTSAPTMTLIDDEEIALQPIAPIDMAIPPVTTALTMEAIVEAQRLLADQDAAELPPSTFTYTNSYYSSVDDDEWITAFHNNQEPEDDTNVEIQPPEGPEDPEGEEQS